MSPPAGRAGSLRPASAALRLETWASGATEESWRSAGAERSIARSKVANRELTSRGPLRSLTTTARMQKATRCACGARLAPRRRFATAADVAPPSAAFAPPPGAPAPTSKLPSRERTRLLVATVVSRPPVLLPALSDFEKSYYAYQRGIHHALSGHFDPSWYFRSGSAAEGAFRELDAREQRGEDPPMPAAEGDDGAATDAAVDYRRDRDLSSPRRQLDRTLYLLVRKNRKQHAWQFRASRTRRSSADSASPG